MKKPAFLQRLYVWDEGRALRQCAEVRVDTTLLDRLGPESWLPDLSYPGPASPSRGWLLEAECGLQFVVWQESYRPDGATDLCCVEVSTEDEVAHAINHLPFTCSVVRLLAGPVLSSGWRVSRMDEAGVRHHVGLYPFASSAECVAKTFEARGHKQTYFVDQVGTPPTTGPGVWAVRRQDENGNVFTVDAHPFRGVAEAQAEWLASSPLHRQLYWVERAS